MESRSDGLKAVFFGHPSVVPDELCVAVVICGENSSDD